jgi:putative oxidoreductase
MIGAILLVKVSKGFIGGFELDLLYLAIMISLILTGPGSLSIEKNILKREIFPKSPKYSINKKEDKQNQK